MSEIRIVFDIGGVLVNTSRRSFIAHLSNLTGRPIGLTECRAFLEGSVVRAFEVGKLGESDFITHLSRYFSLEGARRGAILDVWCSILSAPTATYRLLDEIPPDVWMLASNTNALHWQRLCLDYPGLRRGQPPLLSYRIGVLKPHSIFFHQLNSVIQRKARTEILYVDDKAENVSAARTAGFHGICASGTTTTLREDVLGWLGSS